MRWDMIHGKLETFYPNRSPRVPIRSDVVKQTLGNSAHQGAFISESTTVKDYNEAR